MLSTASDLTGYCFTAYRQLLVLPNRMMVASRVLMMLEMMIPSVAVSIFFAGV